jgi:hypothetical protein
VIRILFRNIFRYGSNTASVTDTPTVIPSRTTTWSSTRVISAAQLLGSLACSTVRVATRTRTSAMAPEVVLIRNVFHREEA